MGRAGRPNRDPGAVAYARGPAHVDRGRCAAVVSCRANLHVGPPAWAHGGDALVLNAVVGGSARALAAVLAAVTVMTLVCLIVFFAVGEPWGSLNDAGNALMALLCGAFAVSLYRATSVVATSLAVLGAAVGLLGSYLVMTDTTGYFLAGLVSAAGFALIGSWLVVLGRAGGVPASLLAQVVGGVMAIGLVNVPGILRGFDDLESVPWWILAAEISWAGTYLLLPLWALRYARAPLVRASPTAVVRRP
jgi:hypothetical protein